MEWNPTYLETKLNLACSQKELVVLNGQERLKELIRKNNKLPCRMPKRVIDFLKEFEITNVFATYNYSIMRYIVGIYQGEEWTFSSKIYPPDEWDPMYFIMGWTMQKKNQQETSLVCHFHLSTYDSNRHFDFFNLICPAVGSEELMPKDFTEDEWMKLSFEERKRVWAKINWAQKQLILENKRVYGVKSQKRKSFKQIKDM